MTELDKRIYRAALHTGVPVFTHLAIDLKPAVAIFRDEGLDLSRVLFGHVDDGINHQDTPDEWIVEQGGILGFDSILGPRPPRATRTLYEVGSSAM